MADAKTSLKVEGPRTRKMREIVAAHRALSTKSGKIDMKGAVQSAFAFIEGFFPDAKDVLLEEVELKQGHYENSPSEGRMYKQHPFWRVVVSFKSGTPGTLSEVMGGAPRLFREVKVERDSGEIHSMVSWGQ